MAWVKRMLYYSSARFFRLQLEQALFIFAVRVWSRWVSQEFLQAGSVRESTDGATDRWNTLVARSWNVRS